MRMQPSMCLLLLVVVSVKAFDNHWGKKVKCERVNGEVVCPGCMIRAGLSCPRNMKHQSECPSVGPGTDEKRKPPTLPPVPQEGSDEGHVEQHDEEEQDISPTPDIYSLLIEELQAWRRLAKKDPEFRHFLYRTLRQHYYPNPYERYIRDVSSNNRTTLEDIIKIVEAKNEGKMEVVDEETANAKKTLEVEENGKEKVVGENGNEKVIDEGGEVKVDEVEDGKAGIDEVGIDEKGNGEKDDSVFEEIGEMCEWNQDCPCPLICCRAKDCNKRCVKGIKLPPPFG